MNTRMDAEPNDDPTDTTDDPAVDTPAERDDTDDSAHLDSLPDGAGCAEVWEHLSETRDDEEE